MPLQHLSGEDLRQTLSRAREIAEQSREPTAPDAELASYLEAAEEMGISREAMLHALRERMLIHGESFAVGKQVFALSVDGYWYPAEVTELGEHTANVRFVNGSDHTCALSDLRPLSLLPGRKVEADVKDWGWWEAVVEKFDPATGKVHIVHDDLTGEKEKVPLRRIRLTAEQAGARGQEKMIAERASAKANRYLVVVGALAFGAGLLCDNAVQLVLSLLRALF